jgi:PleD family two-component response regulator
MYLYIHIYIGEGGVDISPNLYISAMHILIVDDSKMNRKMVSKFLKGIYLYTISFFSH